MGKALTAALQATSTGRLMLVRCRARLTRYRKLRLALLATLFTAGAAYATVAAHPGAHAASATKFQADTSIAHDAAASNQTVSSSDVSVSSSGAAGSSETNDKIAVTLNGQPVSVPANGELHKHLSDDKSDTSIDISHDSSGLGSSTTLDIQLNSTSSATVGGGENE